MEHIYDTHTHTYALTPTHTLTHRCDVHVYMLTHTHTHIRTSTYTLTQTRAHTHTHTHTQAHTHAHAHALKHLNRLDICGYCHFKVLKSPANLFVESKKKLNFQKVCLILKQFCIVLLQPSRFSPFFGPNKNCLYASSLAKALL